MSDVLAPSSPIKLRWFFGIIGAFLIFVVIAAYSSRMAKDTPDYDSERGAERIATLAKLREADEKTLTTADWLDATKGTVRIPIDEALPETVDALKAKPVQMGAEIPGVKPSGAPVPNDTGPSTTMHTIPAVGENEAPAGSGKAPSTNAAPAQPQAPSADAPNK